MVFEKGHSGGPGRPKGSRNRLSETFLSAIWDDFQQHGAAAITEARERDAVAYVRMIAGLLPKDIELTPPKKLVEWTDAEILAKLDEFISPDDNGTAARSAAPRKGSNGTNTKLH